MSEIHVLPPVLANRIAAGEVVERPASIVKELVENSIDAGADSVSVSITDGGISSITVTDNGCGIEKEQCETAFLRHATSKISTSEDLAAIESLGFRGEALASICAVSSVTITTRTRTSDTGLTMRIDSGDTVFSREIVCPSGTTLKVENLFAKVPARLRFLKSSRYEAGYCGDYISRMILSRPDISFHYMQDGKTVYETFGDGILKNAIYAVYGPQVYSHLRKVEYDDGYISVNGFIGTQELSYQNRTHESFFINGRFIKSNILLNAVEVAYATKIMIGKFPFAVLSLTISPREVDVNVHPSKTQIRFAAEQRVCNAVTAACSQALKDAVIPIISIPSVSSQSKKEDGRMSGEFLTSQTNTEIINDAHHEYRNWMKELGYGSSMTYHDKSEYSYSDFTPKKEEQNIPEYKTPVNAERDVPAVMVNRLGEFDTEKVLQESLGIPADYTIIGCVFNAYWIVEHESSIYLIDQHAACERRLYDKLMSEQTEVSSQNLISPVSVSMQPVDFSLVLQHRDELEKLGFRYCEDGILQIAVSAVPVINGTVFKPEFILEAVNYISIAGKVKDDKHYFYEQLVYASCKHAIKAGERITTDEIKELIEFYIKNGTPLTCPHGRPVVISLSKQEIEKNFKRIV